MADGGESVFEGDLFKHGSQIVRRHELSHNWAVPGKPPKATPVVFAAPQTVDIYTETMPGACDPVHLFEQLGMILNQNEPNFTASVLQVVAKSEVAKSGNVQPGHMILQINDYWCGSADFESICFAMKEISTQQPPTTDAKGVVSGIKLTLLSPTVGGNKDVLTVYCLEDPTGFLPHELGFLIKDKGVQVVQVETGRNICFWPFCMMAQIKHIERTDDDYMELFVFDLIGWGSLVVETSGQGAHGGEEWWLDLEGAMDLAEQDCKTLLCPNKVKVAEWVAARQVALDAEAAEAAAAEESKDDGKTGKKGWGKKAKKTK
jgi:hypothetical protein